MTNSENFNREFRSPSLPNHLMDFDFTSHIIMSQRNRFSRYEAANAWNVTSSCGFFVVDIYQVHAKYIPDVATPGSRVQNRWGLANCQSMKKPIDAFLVLLRPVLNALIVVESMTLWSKAVPSVNNTLWEKVTSHSQSTAILAEWPLVLLSSIRVNKLSKLLVDHPLYILNTSKRSVLFHLSSSVHRPIHSSLLS